MVAARLATVVIMSRSLFITLTGPKWEYYIIKEVNEEDELDKGKIFAAAGKQDK